MGGFVDPRHSADAEDAVEPILPADDRADAGLRPSKDVSVPVRHDEVPLCQTGDAATRPTHSCASFVSTPRTLPRAALSRSGGLAPHTSLRYWRATPPVVERRMSAASTGHRRSLSTT